MYRGQVIAIDAEAGNLLRGDPKDYLEQNEEYGGWGKRQMTPAEKKALAEFVANYEGASDGDYILRAQVVQGDFGLY